MGGADADRRWFAKWPAEVPRHLEYPKIPVDQMLRDAARDYADRPATLFYGARLTYGEIDAFADRFAAGLRSIGVKKGDRVGLILPNSPAFIIAFFGVLRAGGIVVQTSPLYTPRELTQLYADSGATVVVALDLLLPNLLQAKPNTPVRHVVVADVKDWLPGLLGALYPIKKKKDLKKAGHWPLAIPAEPWVQRFSTLLDHPPEPGRRPPMDPEQDVAVLQYTGGTTGLPKGAMLTHANLVANVFQMAAWLPFARPGRERTMAVLPMFHVGGLNGCMLLSVRLAATMILHPDPREAGAILKLIRKARPTLFPGVPTLYLALLNHPDLRKTDMKGIRACFSGAAPLPLEVRRRFERLTGGKLVEVYGLTEATTIVTANPLTEDGLVKDGIGIPIPDTDVRVMDVETGTREMPVGESGELTVRGPQIMKGYWSRLEETAGVLRDGWLYTGDVAVMDDDGYFSIVDRKKDMIDASGFKVYPREVEEVLFQHPAVQEAAVVGVPDPYRGETVMAFIVLKAAATVTEQELIAFCKERLAAYKVPKTVALRKELPKTLVGKVLRRALREEVGVSAVAKTQENEKRVVAADGVELHLRWTFAPRPKGTVLVVHGIGEHGGRYWNVEDALLPAGWSVFTYDHRGHGRSTGRRTHVNRFDDYADDLQRVYDEVQSIAGKGKVFLWGHSMGALIITVWAGLRRPAVWGAILVAPPFRIAVPVPKAKIVAAKILSNIVPALALANEVDPGLLSRDPAVGKAYALDPLVQRKATVRWGAEFLAAVDRVNARAQEVQVPYLLLHGTGDQITSAEGSKEFHDKTASSDKALKLYEGYYHELHNEPEAERAKVFADVLAWLDARV